jgi:hypothetical protein
MNILVAVTRRLKTPWLGEGDGGLGNKDKLSTRRIGGPISTHAAEGSRVLGSADKKYRIVTSQSLLLAHTTFGADARKTAKRERTQPVLRV